MNVGLLLITHNRIGTELLGSATTMLAVPPRHVEVLEVHPDDDPDWLFEQARLRFLRLQQGHGVLVLTDIYGSTPSNIANRLSQEGRAYVVTGLNLPMLIRVLNYAQLTLPELVEKAVSGGRDGVVQGRSLPPNTRA